MTALADALTAAQTRAVAALGKQYVGGTMDEDAVRIALDSIGLQDPADTNRWLAALTIIRETGASLPRENGAAPEAKATDAQRKRIRDDVTKLHGAEVAENIAGEPSLTKAQASEIISSIVAGTFDVTKWAVPF